MKRLMKSGRKKILAIAASLAVSAGLAVGPYALGAVFYDVQGHWAQNAISELSSENIIGGYPDNTFRPEGQITRAEFAAIMARALGLSLDNQYTGFRDVSPGHWAAPAVSAVREAGLVSGYPGNVFLPNRNISRAEVLTVLAQANNAPSPSPAEAWQVLSRFGDAGRVPGWARPAVAETVQTGVFVNRPGFQGVLTPQRNATRAEVAVMVDNLRDRGFDVASTQQVRTTGRQVAYGTGTTTIQGRVSTIPANTEFTATLQTPAGSEISRVGDRVAASVDQPLISSDNRILIPAGSQLIGTVTQVDDAAYAEIPGTLDITFNEVVLPSGQRMTIQASVATENGVLRGDTTKGRILKTVGKTALGAGLGAALGTAIGPLSGGEVGRGAIYGTAIGAGVGALASVADRGDEVVLQAGDQLILRLEQPVVVEAPQ